MGPRRGDVVLVAFPFTDLTATKVRPALVVSPAPYHRATPDVLLAAISSVLPTRPLASDVVVRRSDPEFAATGLKCASVILCGKLFTMERRLLLRSLGRLGGSLLCRIDPALAAALGMGPWR